MSIKLEGKGHVVRLEMIEALCMVVAEEEPERGQYLEDRCNHVS